MRLHAVDDTPDFEKPWMKDYKFHLVDTIDKLKKLVNICIDKKIYSLDLETSGVDNRVYPDEYFGDGVKTRHGMRTIDRIVGVCISFDGKNGYYTPLSHEPEGSNNLPWDPAWDELERLVHSGSKAIGHNSGKFDNEFLYPVTGKEYWKIDEYEDTFFIAKILNPIKTSPSGLKPLTKQHFNVEMIELNDLFTDEMREQLKREKKSLYNFGVLHPKEGLAYGCSDGIFTYLLYFKLQEMMSDGDRKIYNLEKSFCNVLRKLERNRVHIDVKALNKLNDDATEAIQTLGDKIRQAIESWTGRTSKWLTLNLGSPKQLSEVFITDPEGLRLKPTQVMLKELEEGGNGFRSNNDEDDDSSGPSTDMAAGNIVYSTKDEALKSLKTAHGKKYLVDIGHKDENGNPKLENVFELIIEYRHYMKLRGSYTEPLSLAVDKNGDVRPDFRQLGTDTARLSSRAGDIDQGYAGINFQGIPRDSDDDKPELFKKIRSVIIPREGYALVKLDFAGEELRVVTNLSGDPIWTDSFLNKDGDVHAITAKTLFAKDQVSKDERNRGKRCNFAFIYGGGAGAIQRNIDCTMEDAQRHMANLKRDVPVLMGYVDHQKEYAKKHKGIFTAFGRRIPIPTIDSPIKMIRSKAERCAINYTIQATSADILKFAMCFVDKNIRANGWENDVKYVLTVHDEVVYEIRPHMLMEVVRKLDEWMTMPWKLPKAHGRDWVVPLLTEPGIDVNWKARYDYFKMVDGVPAEPKLMDAEGKYTGKLKKDEFFLEGRVYQKVPDFLSSYIFRGGKPESIAGTVIAPSPAAQVPKTEVKEEKPKESAPESRKAEDTTNAHQASPKPPEVPSKAVPEIVDVEPISAEPVGVVHRFVLRAQMNEYNVRRLQAVCILSEGPDMLRIVSSDGKVIVPEERAPKVNIAEFSVLTKMFGLG